MNERGNRRAVASASTATTARLQIRQQLPWTVLLLALAGALAGALAARGQARELAWRALEVHAHLDADGRLHVRERHAMVFTGDWNGGEREFRVALGQKLDLEHLWREVPDGTGALHLQELEKGDLDGGRPLRLGR